MFSSCFFSFCSLFILPPSQNISILAMYQVHCIFYVPGQVLDTLEMLWTWTFRNIARNAYIVGWREYIVSISKSCFVLLGETDVRMIQVLYHDVCLLLFFFIEIRQVFEPVRFELGSCRSSKWCHLFPLGCLDCQARANGSIPSFFYVLPFTLSLSGVSPARSFFFYSWALLFVSQRAK